MRPTTTEPQGPTETPAPAKWRHLNREQILRTLTFWLRPEFVLRVLNRFQKVVGFDRAIALSASALTALIPLAIVTSALASHLGGKDTADRIIERYGLTGGGAEAVKDIFSPAAGSSTGIGFLGFLFLLIAVLSFTRAVQRLFEQTWELKPLSVRNSANGLLWLGGLLLYLSLTGLVRALLGRSSLDLTAAVLTIPLSLVFLVWSGWVLSAKRIPALFCVMVIVVGAAAAGREIHDELGRIRRGERPAEDEVRRQWDEVTAEGRSRWEAARTRVNERRRGRD
jgi:membrane protein